MEYTTQAKSPAANSESKAMSLGDWLNKQFKLKGKPEDDKARNRELVSDAYETVAKVTELRKDVLEDRNFPIASFLRGESPTYRRRVKP